MADEDKLLEAETSKVERKKTKDRLPKRKKEKKAKIVTFEVEGFEGEFEAPDLNSVPLKVQRKLMVGDLTPLVETLGEYGAVIDDMDNSEIQDFLGSWTEASGIDLKN